MASRPYKAWTREQISERISEYSSERERLIALSQQNDREMTKLENSLWYEKKKIFGRIERLKKEPDLEHLKKNLHLSSIGAKLSGRRAEIAKDTEQLELEMRIRDSPELVAEFGPGAD